jgi:hypothetical protein
MTGACLLKMRKHPPDRPLDGGFDEYAESKRKKVRFS